MLSFMHAQYSLYQQGYNLLDEIDPYMKKLAAEVSSVPCALLIFLRRDGGQFGSIDSVWNEQVWKTVAKMIFKKTNLQIH